MVPVVAGYGDGDVVDHVIGHPEAEVGEDDIVITLLVNLDLFLVEVKGNRGQDTVELEKNKQKTN